jgi:hypothetical protein
MSRRRCVLNQLRRRPRLAGSAIFSKSARYFLALVRNRFRDLSCLKLSPFRSAMSNHSHTARIASRPFLMILLWVAGCIHGMGWEQSKKKSSTIPSTCVCQETERLPARGRRRRRISPNCSVVYRSKPAAPPVELLEETQGSPARKPALSGCRPYPWRVWNIMPPDHSDHGEPPSRISYFSPF